MRTHCDKCKSQIIDGRCDCGVWCNKEDHPDLRTFEESMSMYDTLCEKSSSYSPMSGDDNKGTCFVFFRGDACLCDKVREYLKH